MTNVCKICTHPKVREINKRLVEGGIVRQLAKEFDVSLNSLYRHKLEHLPKKLIQAFKSSFIKHNNSLVERAEEIQNEEIQHGFDLQEGFMFVKDQTLELYELNKKKGFNALALKCLDSLRQTYGMIISILDKIAAQKELELAILKEKSGEKLQAEKEKFEQDIKILNFEELKMLQRIQNKITNQTDETLILDGRVMGWDHPLFSSNRDDEDDEEI